MRLTTENSKSTKLYNLLFPIWFLIWIPSWLWLLLIPANYILDTAVTYFTLPKDENRWLFCKRHTWKVCLAGFFSDLVGSLILFVIGTFGWDLGVKWLKDAGYALYDNPFANPLALFICIFAIAVAGVLIYFIDRKILMRAGLALNQAKKSARWLAIITAPYLFLIPAGWIYG